MWKNKTGTESSMTQMLMTTERTMPQRTSPLAWHCTTERAHVILFLAHFITLTFGSSSSLARTSLTVIHMPSMCATSFFTLNSTLYFPAFLLSVFLFPFFHLSDEQQPELNKKIMENLCDSANNGGEGTYDVLYLTTRYEAPETDTEVSKIITDIFTDDDSKVPRCCGQDALVGRQSMRRNQ